MPIPVPSVPPDNSPTKSLSVSPEWVGILIGLLLPLTEASAWEGTPSEKEQASEWADELIDQLMA